MTRSTDPLSLAQLNRDLLLGWNGFADHRTGSSAHGQASEWLATEVAQWAPVERIAVPLRVRTPRTARLEIGPLQLHGLPAFDAPGTPANGISGTLCSLPSNGGIGFACVTPQLDTPSSRAFVAARAANQHAALVVTTDPSRHAAGIAPFNADDWPHRNGPPVLQLDARHTAEVQRAANQGATARLVIDDRWSDAIVHNIATTVPGQVASLGPVIVMTPRSGWWVCTAERGGGLVCWFAALRRMVAAPGRRAVRFTANTGHELGHIGLEQFVTNDDSARTAHLWLHLGANFAARGGRVRLQYSDAETREVAQRHLGRFVDDETPLGTRPLGEARNVFDLGGRYISILGSNPLFHHPSDRWPDAVDIERTDAITAAVADLVAELAG